MEESRWTKQTINAAEEVRRRIGHPKPKWMNNVRGVQRRLPSLTGQRCTVHEKVEGRGEETRNQMPSGHVVLSYNYYSPIHKFLTEESCNYY